MTRKFRLLTALVFVLLLFTVGKPAYARLPHINIFNPYFDTANQTTLWLNYRAIALEPATLNSFDFTLNYGINENLNVGFNVPWNVIFHTESAGILGDVGLHFKASLARSPNLNWRLIMGLYLKVGTGPFEEDSTYRVRRESFVSYYPFATGTHQMTPALQFSFIVWDILFATSVMYISENQPGDDMFYLDDSYDRMDFQLYIDYFFKFMEGSKDYDYLGFRPALVFNYQQNLTDRVIYPSGFYGTLELNFKWQESWRWETFVTLPVWTDAFYYNVELGIEIGKML